MELLIKAQTYGLTSVLVKCIEFARKKTLVELQTDAFFKSIHTENVVKILSLRCKSLENRLEQSRKAGTEPELYGNISSDTGVSVRSASPVASTTRLTI